ncbi:DUF4260 domain-containing protein [Labrenzia sp. 011]|uniref:DUF4260 domain-containing protein n=1 Tax=Labrenzia sp. 011 TaxID=2171494 RepID=UPI000D520620|nr:DUF4260 domain-containing protein [Labrenzia sp. 011]PVB60994.1 DUF4260 domain-containing protein [Labrenzia sp. 011]
MTGEKSLLAWQRIEALFVFLATLALYSWSGAPWWIFLLLFPVPDLSMLGYLAGPRFGAFAYNLLHSFFGPAFLLICGVILTEILRTPDAFQDVVPLCLIWASHIAFDRVLGYGLKSPAGFGITHLGHMGRKETET